MISSGTYFVPTWDDDEHILRIGESHQPVLFQITLNEMNMFMLTFWRCCGFQTGFDWICTWWYATSCKLYFYHQQLHVCIIIWGTTLPIGLEKCCDELLLAGWRLLRYWQHLQMNWDIMVIYTTLAVFEDAPQWYHPVIKRIGWGYDTCGIPTIDFLVIWYPWES